MKATAIANLSLNGKVLLAEVPHHQAPKAGQAFFLQKVRDAGCLVLGKNTFDLVTGMVGGESNLHLAFPGTELVLLSSDTAASEYHHVAGTPEAALAHLAAKGFESVVVGGGTAAWNAFLEKNLLTDLYLAYVPVITGEGGVLAGSGALFNRYRLRGHWLLEEGVVQQHLVRADD